MNNRIIIGGALEYTDEIIRSGSINGLSSSSLVGDTLEIDEFKFRTSWVDESGVYEIYKTRGGGVYQDRNGKVYKLNTRVMPDLLAVLYATPVEYYQDSTLRIKMYFDHAEQVSKTDFVVTCVSAIGLLDKQTHLGGLYTGQTALAVIREIIDGAIPYTVAEDLASARVYGWLPIESKREALHQLLFAFGADVRRSANGNVKFAYLNQTSAKQIPDSRIFYGGKDYHVAPYNKVEVTEHTYFQSQYDETVTLFDNTSPGSTPAGNTFITFQEAPVYGLQASAGLTLNSYDVNWAIVSGTGILTGKKYAHQRGLATRSNPNITGTDRVAKSEKCTLVTMLTSPNVTRRLLSYYGSAQKFDIDIERTNETVGDQVQFGNPYGGTVNGFIGSLDWKVSSFERAKAQIVTNYVPAPPGGGGGYSNLVKISSAQSWSVPAGVTDITIVLIGGGQGGQGGKNGSAGTAGSNVTSAAGQTNYSSGGAGGAGGAAGAAGHAGKVFQARYEVTPGASLTFAIGAGGNGGAVGGSNGSDGGNTTVSGGGISASSADGAVPVEGYFEVMEQSLYATDGSAGTEGGAGGDGGNASNQNGVSGSNVGSKRGGNPGSVVNTSAATTGYRLPKNSEYTETVEEVTGQLEYVTGYYRDRSGTGDSNFKGVPEYITCNEDTGSITVESGHYHTSRIMLYTYSEASESVFTKSGDTITVIYVDRPRYSNITYKHTRVYKSVFTTVTPKWTAKQFAGGGGGASPTTNGGNASNNNAGNGANATAPSAATVAGSGGTGGNGGGGGGGGGGASITARSDYTTATTKSGGAAGTGGAGSAGGKGANGVALIYY